MMRGSILRATGLLALVFLVIAGIVSLYRNYHLKQDFTVSYINAHDVVVYDLSPTTNSEDRRFVSNVDSSGQVLRLYTNKKYGVSYKGDVGYSDGQIEFTPTKNNKGVKLNPYYSSARLQAMVGNEIGAINQALEDKYPKIKLYDIRPGKLYHWGDWYGTLLKKKGVVYDQGYDSLRVVLAKENNAWIVKTDPPNITLNKYSYPGVPVDVLRDVNNSPQFKAVPFDTSKLPHGAHPR